MSLFNFNPSKLFSHVWLFATLWTVAHQTPLSMDSPGKNTGVGCYALLQGIFPTQGSNPCLSCLLHWQGGSSPLGEGATWEAPSNGCKVIYPWGFNFNLSDDWWCFFYTHFHLYISYFVKYLFKSFAHFLFSCLLITELQEFICVYTRKHAQLLPLCLFADPMDCSPPGSSVHETL